MNKTLFSTGNAMIEIGINSQILAQVLDGRKTVEGRLAKGKFLAIQPGDVISIREDIYRDGVIIESKDATVKVKVVDVRKFDSFKEMLDTYGYQSVIPSAHNSDEARDEYALYYSHDDERQYGVIGISFQLLQA